MSQRRKGGRKGAVVSQERGAERERKNVPVKVFTGASQTNQKFDDAAIGKINARLVAEVTLALFPRHSVNLPSKKTKKQPHFL